MEYRTLMFFTRLLSYLCAHQHTHIPNNFNTSNKTREKFKEDSLKLYDTFDKTSEKIPESLRKNVLKINGKIVSNFYENSVPLYGNLSKIVGKT